jgi:hypothetical protein
VRLKSALLCDHYITSHHNHHITRTNSSCSITIRKIHSQDDSVAVNTVSSSSNGRSTELQHVRFEFHSGIDQGQQAGTQYLSQIVSGRCLFLKHQYSQASHLWRWDALFLLLCSSHTAQNELGKIAYVLYLGSLCCLLGTKVYQSKLYRHLILSFCLCVGGGV